MTNQAKAQELLESLNQNTEVSEKIESPNDLTNLQQRMLQAANEGDEFTLVVSGASDSKRSVASVEIDGGSTNLNKFREMVASGLIKIKPTQGKVTTELNGSDLDILVSLDVEITDKGKNFV